VTLVVAETGEIVSRPIEDLEEIIGRGLETFVEVGDALAEVRDAKLYLQFHPTFEAYCSERWGLTRKRAYDLISAAETVNELSPIGDTPLPTNEAQARELRPLKGKPEEAAAAMRKASEATGGKPTAKAITEAVQDIVDDAVDKAEKRAEDKAAIRNLNEKYQPEGFDPKDNERRLEERGKWAERCRELGKLRSPADFLADHKADLTPRQVEYAERAYEWLDEFLLTYREAQ
jgi:hypothetical protein